MILKPSPVAAAARSYSEVLAELVGSKWTVVTEGPSGAQLKHPRVMRSSTKVILAIGVVGLLAAGVGIILIIAGLIEYFAQSERTFFLNRERPDAPPSAAAPKMGRTSKGLLVLVIVIFVAAVVVSMTSR